MTENDVLTMRQVAYVMAMSVCGMAEIEGMKALNTYRQNRGEVIAYNEEAFTEVPLKYGLHPNAVLGTLAAGR